MWEAVCDSAGVKIIWMENNIIVVIKSITLLKMKICDWEGKNTERSNHDLKHDNTAAELLSQVRELKHMTQLSGLMKKI